MSKRIILALCALSLLFVPAQSAKRRVHTIGDSTMSDYRPPATPKRGWGMYLQAFFNPDSVEVNNRGKSGASTRTFYETDNLWPSVRKQMRPGDYLIIQFAHNDEKCKGEDVYVQNAKLRAEGKDTLTDMRGTEPNTTYKAYLRRFVNEAREMGVTPILMSPICRAYFDKDGKINDEGQHKLQNTSLPSPPRGEAPSPRERVGVRSNDQRPTTKDKDYVRCMREVAQEMKVPFLDMTKRSRELYEEMGQNYCMTHYFNCGDKTHTGIEGGMTNAILAYRLIKTCPELEELHHLVDLPPVGAMSAYERAIEDQGKREAFAAKGTPFELRMTNDELRMKNIEFTKKGYAPADGAWPAGEIDEVANRYIEYTIPAEKKKWIVIEQITLPVQAKGGDGMNIHINYGFGTGFRDVTTIYENTALPKNKWLTVRLEQPILVPAGDTLHLRLLPWYDSNGTPRKKKYLQLGELQIQGKK